MKSPDPSNSTPAVSRHKMILIISACFGFAAALFAAVVSIPKQEEPPAPAPFLPVLPTPTPIDPDTLVLIEQVEPIDDPIQIEAIPSGETGELIAQNDRDLPDAESSIDSLPVSPTSDLPRGETTLAVNEEQANTAAAHAPSASPVAKPDEPTHQPQLGSAAIPSVPNPPEPSSSRPILGTSPTPLDQEEGPQVSEPAQPVAVASSTTGKKVKPTALLVVPMREVPSKNKSKRKSIKSQSRNLVSSGQMDYFRYTEAASSTTGSSNDSFDTSKLRNGTPANVKKEDAEAFAAWMTNTYRKAKRLPSNEQFRLPSRSETSNQKVWRLEDPPATSDTGVIEKRPFGIVAATKPDSRTEQKPAIPTKTDQPDSKNRYEIPVKETKPGDSPLRQNGPDKQLFKR